LARPGLTSSAAAANSSRSLGAILGTSFGTFAGRGIDENSILVAYAVIGDLNLDKTVSIADFIALASNFGLPAAGAKAIPTTTASSPSPTLSLSLQL